MVLETEGHELKWSCLNHRQVELDKENPIFEDLLILNIAVVSCV